MLKFSKRARPSVPEVSDPLKIRDLMEYRQLQDVMGPQYLVDPLRPSRFILRRAEPRSLFGVDVRLVERSR
jgi:hypothetical protein